MTDVVVPVFIPYARFLEARARRLAIETDITPPDEHPTNVAVCSAPIANDESSAGAVVRALTTAKVDGEQQIGRCPVRRSRAAPERSRSSQCRSRFPAS